jgi:ferredoxin
MKRQVIKINEELCTGCGACIPNCPEGAIQIIDGKARLISDLFCDGLGACIGSCPVGAITIETREAEPYDEKKVMENIVKQGTNTIRAHLEHLKAHNQMEYLKQAVEFLKDKGIPNPLESKESSETQGSSHSFSGCPGSRSMNFTKQKREVSHEGGDVPSELTHWPIQLHLISPLAEQYRKRDVVLSADCVAYAFGNFHQKYLKNNALAIACPKLDSEQEIYEEKIKALIDEAQINTLTVVTMEVPCCRGLLHLALSAAEKAKRKVPVKHVVIGISGEILSEEWC